MNDRISKYLQNLNFFRKQKSITLSKEGTIKDMLYINWISSGLFGDIYSAELKYETSKQKDILQLRKKRSNAAHFEPEYIVKHAYNSKWHRIEAEYNKFITKFTIKHNFPHFPITYSSYTTRNAKFRGINKTGVYKSGENWDLVKKGSGIITVMEYIGISYSQFMDLNHNKQKTNNIQIISSIAQIILSIYTLNHSCNILHEDLYFSNISMKKLENPTLFIYQLNSTNYYILSEQYYPILIDFGQSSKISKNNKYGWDIYTFLMEFTLGYDNNSPSMINNNLAMYYNIPSTNNIIRNMLDKLIKNHLPFNGSGNETPEQFLHTKYTNGAYMFKKVLSHLFIEKPSGIFNEVFINLDVI